MSQRGRLRRDMIESDVARERFGLRRSVFIVDADGRFLALDVHTIANLGAYMSGGGPGSSTNAPSAAMATHWGTS